jgi:ERF superfamily
MPDTDKYEKEFFHETFSDSRSIINQTKKELREEFLSHNETIDMSVYAKTGTNNMSCEINEIAGALSKAQGMLENVTKDSKGYGYKYSSLAGCLEACKIPLSANGLAVTHLMEIASNDQNFLTTILFHTSGQWIKSVFPLIFPPPPPGTKNLKTPMQELGSCITYARRYGLSAIIGLAQTDDDAAANVKEDPVKVSSKENPLEVRNALKKQIGQLCINNEVGIKKAAANVKEDPVKVSSKENPLEVHNALKKQIGQLCINNEVDIKKFAEFHKLGEMDSNKLRESIMRFEALLYEFENFNFTDEEEVDDVQTEEDNA